MESQVLVVIPVFNEENNIKSLVERISFSMKDEGISQYRIIIVNDGSSDGTEDIITSLSKEYPIQVLNHDVNQGLGRTIKDGLKAAAAQSFDRDIIITMDGDDTHTPGLIPRLIRSIREGYDVVIASRYRLGSRVLGVSYSRKFFSYMASLIFRFTFPIQGVRDYTCGYRAYRSSVIKSAFEHYGKKFVDQEGFQCMVDILLKLRKMKLIFGEVPFILRYDYKGGLSKMNVNKTIVDTFSLIFKRLFKGVK